MVHSDNILLLDKAGSLQCVFKPVTVHKLFHECVVCLMVYTKAHCSSVIA